MRRTALKRGTSRLKRAWLRPKKRKSRVLWRTGRVVLDSAGRIMLRGKAFRRSKGFCECWRATGKKPCGLRVEWQGPFAGHLHHIKFLSHGGSDAMRNLAFIASVCHEAIHGRLQWRAGA